MNIKEWEVDKASHFFYVALCGLYNRFVDMKVKKGYSVDEMADMLEEHVDAIVKIIKEIE